MNERIKELFDQAKVECFNMGSKTATTVGYDELEKFAELIVQECASIVYKTCQDGDAGAQAILYEFDIDNARSQK